MSKTLYLYSVIVSAALISLMLAGMTNAYAQNEKFRAKLDGNNEVPTVDTPAEGVITFKTKGGHTLVQVMDTMGRLVKVLTEKDYAPGVYNIDFNSSGLSAGVYYTRLQNGAVQHVRPMLKTK